MDFDAPEPDPRARDRLDQIGPILAVVSARDHPSVLARGDELEAAGAQLVTIAGAAHLPSLEQPAEFERVVVSFLDANA